MRSRRKAPEAIIHIFTKDLKPEAGGGDGQGGTEVGSGWGEGGGKEGSGWGEGTIAPGTPLPTKY